MPNYPLIIQVSDEVFEWLKKKGEEFSTDTMPVDVAKEILLGAIEEQMSNEATDKESQ